MLNIFRLNWSSVSSLEPKVSIYIEAIVCEDLFTWDFLVIDLYLLNPTLFLGKAFSTPIFRWFWFNGEHWYQLEKISIGYSSNKTKKCAKAGAEAKKRHYNLLTKLQRGQSTKLSNRSLILTYKSCRCTCRHLTLNRMHVYI